MGTLWNTYAFFLIYDYIDKFDPTKYNLKDCKLSVMDRWVLSGLNSLIKYVDDCLNEYKIFESARKIQDFVDELSNWYVRRGRERYWGSEMSDDKIAAYMTLYTVLTELSKLIAPYTPFMAENIYQNLVRSFDKNAPESVHLCDFPTADESAIDADMEAQMDALVEVVQLGRACRNLANIKTRQTAAKLYVKGASFSESYQALCEDELNVKEVVFTESAREFTTYQLKPQMRTLGPKYGKLLGKIGQHLQTMDGNDVVDAFERGETVSFDIDGTLVTLGKDDVLTSPMQKSGFVAQEDKGVTVVLDTNLTPELIAEGYVREVVSKVQTMRKDSGFDVTDRVHIAIECGETLKNAVMNDLVTLTLLGVRVVLVHGGGPAINEMLKKVGVESHFANGLRVTDDATMEIVQQVLAGKVNKDLVAKLRGRGVGLCGMDGQMLRCTELDPQLGHVGEIVHVDATLISSLLDGGFIPVIATVGMDDLGQAYNVNADTAAAQIAIALKAEKLVSMTDIAGLLRDKDDETTLIPEVEVSEIEGYKSAGIIAGGMIPKIGGMADAIYQGVHEAVIIDGRVPHSILLELFSDRGSGTRFYRRSHRE